MATTVLWDDAALQLWARTDPRAVAAMDKAAAVLTSAMKKEAPVSPVPTAPAYRGTVQTSGGLRSYGHSGTLRSSIHALRLPDGSVIVGPTADYSAYVVEGTPPHIIRSHGPWPLRNPYTGAVFGPVVHHPGTSPNNFVLRALASVAGHPLIMGTEVV